MTKGDAGQNISKFASSSTDASQISTSLPYISYVDLGTWLSYMVEHASAAISQYFTSKLSVSDHKSTILDYLPIVPICDPLQSIV